MVTPTNILKLCILFQIAIGVKSCTVNTERHPDYTIHGIDVSRYQGDIDWDKVISDSIHFVFIKATEGGDYIDPMYTKHRKALEYRPVKKGAYHFFIPRTDPKRQVDNFYLNSRLSEGDLPPVLDFEKTQGLSIELIQDRLRSVLNGLQQKYDTKPIIYTNLKLYYAHIAGRFDQYPVWIARYDKKAPNLGQKSWTFWQYGDRGQIQGIQGFVDFNVFAGTWSDLDEICLKKDPYHTQDAL